MHVFRPRLVVVAAVALAWGCNRAPTRLLPLDGAMDARPDDGPALDRAVPRDVRQDGGPADGPVTVRDLALDAPVTDGSAADATAAHDIADLAEDTGAFTDSVGSADVAAVPGPSPRTLAVGYNHACAVLPDHSARCWGEGSHGRLGAGAYVSSTVPAAVAGATPFTAATAGSQHTCAISPGGGAWCWGSNTGLQLGTAVKVPYSLTPLPVAGLSANVTDISAGYQTTCAIAAGTTYCWGTNLHGQVGNGSSETGVQLPEPVLGLSGATRVSVGGSHACAVELSGGVRCWGNNSSGQLGNGTLADSSTATPVLGLPGPVVDIQAGPSSTCALTAAGTVWCWGYNPDGMLGLGHPNTSYVYVPQQVVGLGSDVVYVAMGTGHACALLVTGEVRCWGYNDYGQLGTGDFTSWSTPRLVKGLPAPVVSIAAGGHETCARAAGGTWCWGHAKYGQLGIGPVSTIAPPRMVPALGGANDLVAGPDRTCRLDGDGTLSCLGANGCGQLGTGDDEDSISLVSPLGLEPAVSLAALGGAMCVVDSGQLKCTGCALASSKTLQPVPGMSGAITDLALGNDFGCLVKNQGVWCWGINHDGQLGLGSAGSQALTAPYPPQPALGLRSGVTAVATGSQHACAIRGGQLWCWGKKLWGPLAGCDAFTCAAPVAIPGLAAPVQAVAAAPYDKTCALDAEGVKCWGTDSWGPAAGAGPPWTYPLPGKPTQLTMGHAHACALVAGDVYCWGGNIHGQLGLSGVKSSGPTLVPGLPAGQIVRVVAGATHTLAQTAGGAVYGWGSNEHGELGLGFAERTPLPVQVLGL